MRYTIELNYKATIQVAVDANDEGDALDKARNVAEESSIEEFSLTNELESRILSRED